MERMRRKQPEKLELSTDEAELAAAAYSALTEKNGLSGGCILGMVVVGVLVLGVIGYVVVMGFAIGGMMEDAVPGGGPDAFQIPAVPASPVPPSRDCAATKGGVAPPPVAADLAYCDLASANLADAQLVGANLSSAELSGANLTGANLSDANLVFTTLSGANLTSADLTGAHLAGADLTRANLAGATLAGVIWSNTTCPDGTNSDGHADTCVGYGI
jgi:hypothetical protein